MPATVNHTVTITLNSSPDEPVPRPFFTVSILVS